MNEQIDNNWYSPESQKHLRERANEVLQKMKELENQYQESHTIITEKTEFGGVRKRYIKKNNQKYDLITNAAQHPFRKTLILS